MKVDGGRALTSRGQTDWYGSQFSTRRFEQDFTSTIQFKLAMSTKQPRPAYGDLDGMEEWCEIV